VPEDELDQTLGNGCGIFSGKNVQWARLRFSPERARWVAAEQWHPAQTGEWDRVGNWLLQIPYSDDRELVMDIPRHTPDVEVLAPVGLRERGCWRGCGRGWHGGVSHKLRPMRLKLPIN
jgi:hypothetical protein